MGVGVMRLLSGLIADTLRALFGGGRNVVAETVEVFRENAEGAALRSEARHAAAMAQFTAEFSRDRRSWFDRLMDGVNRLPRPLLALSTLGLLAAAMVDPLWFAARMRGLALVPEPLWWLLGVVVSFYFGARQQVKHQSFQRDIAAQLAQARRVADDIAEIDTLRTTAKDAATPPPPQAPIAAANPALGQWLRDRDETR